MSLEEALALAKASSPVVMLNRIFADVPEFWRHSEPGDDITVTVSRFRR
jgi:hypothetical protein